MITKILGQKAPAGSTSTILFQATSECVISTICVCNRNASADEFRIALVPNGLSLGNESYINHTTAISGHLTYTATIGITLSEGDTVYVYSKNGYLTFQAFGQYK